MARLRLFATVAAFAVPSLALANGGGYAFGVDFTGTLAPFQASGTEHVRIVEEDLAIDLRRTDASVAVRYTMRNMKTEPVRVRFGFPVAATYDPGLADEELDPSERRPPGLPGAIQQLKEYRVTANGQPVASDLQVEPLASGKVKPFPGSEALDGIAGWMVSEVTFPPGAPLTLQIRFAADHKRQCEFLSDDEHCEPPQFAYRLSTGAVWNGPIEMGTVTMRADGIAADEVEIAAPRDRFRRDGDRWVWSFRDLEPTLADDISVLVAPRFFEQIQYSGTYFHSYLERADTWGEGHQRFMAKASSTLARAKDHDFGPKHVSEHNPVAPWAEGVAGPGIGQWIELAPTERHPLMALAIWPGFQNFDYQRESEQRKRYDENGRPARIEVLLNGEHRFVATLGDRRGSQLVPILGYVKPVSKLRITLLDVFPGTRFDDTCISKVVLYDRLATAPEIKHPR